VRSARGEARGPRRERQSPRSFALSVPAPAQLAQVDEHSMELYVITPDDIPVTRRIHAAVLVCVKTAAIMSAVLALGPLKEEDYMRLIKGALESKDRLVLQAGCQQPHRLAWPRSFARSSFRKYRPCLFPGTTSRPMSREKFAFGSSGRWRHQKALEHRKNLGERDSPCVHTSSLQERSPLGLLVSVA